MIARIKTDLKNNIVPIAMLAVMWAITELIFHRFCPVVIITGFPCPGCGLSRAFLSLITLHPITAFEYNPSYPLWAALMIAFVIRRYVQGKSTKILQWPTVVVCILTIGIYIFRMTHYFPGKEPLVYFQGNVFARINPHYQQLIEKLLR